LKQTKSVQEYALNFKRLAQKVDQSCII